LDHFLKSTQNCHVRKLHRIIILLVRGEVFKHHNSEWISLENCPGFTSSTKNDSLIEIHHRESSNGKKRQKHKIQIVSLFMMYSFVSSILKRSRSLLCITARLIPISILYYATTENRNNRKSLEVRDCRINSFLHFRGLRYMWFSFCCNFSENLSRTSPIKTKSSVVKLRRRRMSQKSVCATILPSFYNILLHPTSLIRS